MHSVSRSLFTAAVIALSGVAACGDKVVIGPGTGETTNPGGNTPVVTEVRVTPQSAQLSINQTQTFSAAVLGSNLTNFGVTWRSTNTTVATVDANGVVTARANGTANIEATSAQNTNVKGFATVIVNPDIQAGVAVASITNAAGGAINVDSVAGQISIGLNITQGTGAQRLDSVKVFLQCGTTSTEVYRQTFTGGTTPPGTIVAPVNTAAFNATTGAPTYPNASGCTFRSVGYTAGGQTVATTSTQINLRNLDMARVEVVTAKKASTTAGALWNGGDVTVNVVPVIYSSGNAISSSTVSLTATVPDAFTKSQTISTNSGRGSVTFSGSTASTGTNTAIGGLTGSNATVSVSYLGTTGQTITLPTATVTIYPVENPAANMFFRVDNEAPAVATSDLDVTASRQWIGSAFAFRTTGTGTITVPVTGGADEGVNENTVSYQIIPVASFTGLGAGGALGASTSATACALPTGAFTTTNGATAGAIAQTATTNGYRLRLVMTDKLGNVRCFDNFDETFGFDPIVPVISNNTAAGGVGTNNVIESGTAGSGVPFVFNASDTLSGFFRSDSVLRTTVVRNDSASTCIVGTYSATTGVCSSVFTSTSVNLTGQPEGYYTITTFARDVAGNVSPTLVRTGIVDRTAPVVTSGPTQTAAVGGTGTPSMTVSATDNIDLNTITGRTAYSFVGGIDPIFSGSSQQVGTFGLPNTTSATATVTGGTAFRTLSLLSSVTDGTIIETVSPFLQALVTDQANNFALQNGAAVAFTATTATASPIIAASVTSSTGTAPATGTAGTTQTLQFRVRTAGSTTDQPFSSVQVYSVGADGSLTAVGAAQTLAAVSVNPANERVYTYALPSVTRTSPATNYVVIATNAAGFAVMSPVFAS